MPLLVEFSYWDMLWQLLSQIHLLSLQIATETVYLFMLKDLVDGTLEPLLSVINTLLHSLKIRICPLS